MSVSCQGDAEPRGAAAAWSCGDRELSAGLQISLPSCLAMVAVPEGEIRGCMNLLHDMHHFLASKGMFNHMELLLRISIESYY